MLERIVIVGAGQAAAQAVASLRSNGFGGRISIFGDEPHPPYQRPPLSKKFLSGELRQERLELKPSRFYAEGGELRVNSRVMEIERGAQRVRLESGEAVAYDKLLLATGARARGMPDSGCGLAGVVTLRTINDVYTIRGRLKPGARLSVIGGGYIGLEVAAVATMLGLKVTVIETGERCLGRVTSVDVSRFFQTYHRSRGVTIRTGDGLAAFEGASRLEAVHTQSGARIETDVALLGLGALPNVELAQAAGIACENGIAVDRFARTSDPCIFAAGDCTSFPSGLFARRIRLESVHNAIEQAKTAAAAMLGSEQPYDPVPWFWSDQYELKLQIAGLSQGHDEFVVRGDPAESKFAVFYFKSGRIVAVDAINCAPEYMTGRKLIAQRAAIPVERLADTRMSLKDLAA